MAQMGLFVDTLKRALKLQVAGERADPTVFSGEGRSGVFCIALRPGCREADFGFRTHVA
jgi:hypothetical protein